MRKIIYRVDKVFRDINAKDNLSSG